MSVNEMLMAAAGSAGGGADYVEDVFSTYLYTGNGSTQTITNGIDLAGEGGMVWVKGRNNTQPNALNDTARGANFILYSNDTSGQDDYSSFSGYVDQFNSDGFRIKSGSANWNVTNNTYVSWTFRKQPKFFDVVSYTGNNTGQTIAHNLGSVPGMIIVKNLSQAGQWRVYHRSLGATKFVSLNLTSAEGTLSTLWNDTEPTSSVFTVGTNSTVNEIGLNYVAYLFAHDAGGFGTAGTDNVISCGSYTGNGSDAGPEINLGYEPQWLLIKGANLSVDADWFLYDNMRGIATNGNDAMLRANLSNAEFAGQDRFDLTSTGFRPTTGASNVNESGKTFIYMAIRRPMKVPTTGTEVFSATTAQPVSGVMQSSVLTDLQIAKWTGGTQEWFLSSRLQGGAYLATNSTQAEGAVTYKFDKMTGTTTDALGDGFYLSHSFKRASGFMDVVCYTGTGTTGQVINHNLSVVPEMVIIKARNGTSEWFVYHTGLSSGNSFYLNRNYAQGNDGGPAFSLSSTTITFDRTYVSNINSSGANYVAHLLATLAGISKVGSYTGNGSNQTINCGFTAGARFVLIKRTDSTGDWCVFDTARGIVSGNDPFLQLNSSAAEVTGEDAVDPANSGFIVNETTEALNTNAATYIFLAIA